MKKYLLLILTVVICSCSFGQQSRLDEFNRERQKISRNGLLIISGYSAATIIYSAVAQQNASGSTKYFHRMNITWNSITLGIAGIGYLSAKKEGMLNFAGSLKKQGQAEKIFLFNAGLDLAYIAGGAYLKERAESNTGNPLKQKGYGESIMLQGSVLFLFDGIMYLVHNWHGRALNRLSQKINIGATTNGAGIIVRL